MAIESCREVDDLIWCQHTVSCHVDFWEIKVELTPDLSFVTQGETLDDAVDSAIKRLELVR